MGSGFVGLGLGLGLGSELLWLGLGLEIGLGLELGRRSRIKLFLYPSLSLTPFHSFNPIWVGKVKLTATSSIPNS